MLEKNIIFMICLFSVVTFTSVTYASDNSDGYIVKIQNTGKLKFAVTSAEMIAHNTYFAKDDTELNDLKRMYNIEYLEPNYEVKLFAIPEDPIFPEQWNLKMINAQNAWDIGCYGNRVKIGIIDSGIFSHNDINGNVLGGYNFLDNNTNVTDTVGHGSFVSGIIACDSNEAGIVGTAFRSKIIPLKCFDAGKSTYVSTIISALYSAVDDFGCEIINLSLGLSQNTQSFKEAIDYAVNKGVIIIAAVGNDGNNTLYYPAAYENVIGVGSIDGSKTVSSFSQKNGSVFVVAPGRFIYSITSGNGYGTDNGTSFAAPIVTGMAAIAKCIMQNITQTEMQLLLQSTSEDLGVAGYDISYGYGLVDVKSFVEKMLENTNWFVSPIDSNKNIATITIFNNTPKPQTAISMFSNYYDNRFGEIKSTDIALNAKESIDIRFGNTAQTICHYLWDRCNTLIPLYDKRIINQ